MSADVSTVPPLGAGALILANGSIGPVPFEERVSAAAAGGFDGIGLSVWEYTRLRGEGLEIAQMRDALDRHGLRLAELEVFLGFSVSGAAAQSEPIPGVRYTDPGTEAIFFEIADAFGVRHLQAVGTFGTDVLEDDAAEAFAALCDRAADHGLLVALEFVPTTNVPDAGVGQRIVAEAGRPNGGLCVDSWHHFRGRADDDLLRAMSPDRVFMIQLDDGPASPRDPDFVTDTMQHRLPPGDGDFDLVHFLRLLAGMGVAAPISVEVLSAELATKPAAEVATILGTATKRVVNASR
ncbi:sugar phosphate isomerase/epimerase family protein [Geodermatophilus sp. URMC 64]